MPNTTLNEGAKKQIIKVLREEGYPTYAWLLEPFDIYLTDDPEVVGYMIPNQAKIVLNELLNIDQVSTIVRHELLHEWLTHAQRTQKFDKEHPDRMTSHDIANIAADYEISNRGYTEKDKRTARRMKLGDRVLQGLVTEDQHPGWEDLSFEEMYDKLTSEYTKDMNKMKKELQPLLDQLSKISPQELDKLINQAQQQSQGQPQQQSQDQQSQGGSGQNSKDKSDKQKGKGSQGGKGSQEDSTSTEESEGSGASGDSKEAENLRDQAGKAEDQLQDIKDKAQEAQGSSGGPFGDKEDQKAQQELAKKVTEIERRLQDIQKKQQALDEADRVKSKEKVQAAKAKEYKNITSGLSKFRMNFQRFIKDQIDYFRGDTWSRPNKNYAGTGFIVPGKTMYSPGKIPSVNVYWDVSGSFNDPAKTQGARDAIGTINQYVKRGEIVVNVYYFADRVASSPSAAGGGTNGNDVLDHIEQTKPTNVVVITDSDVNNAANHPLVTVPGAVWMLFYDQEADEFAEVLRGKSQTKRYLIEY